LLTPRASSSGEVLTGKPLSAGNMREISKPAAILSIQSVPGQGELFDCFQAHRPKNAARSQNPGPYPATLDLS
jgi:hypothetical protein